MPYVFIHGLGQTAASWDKTIRYMNINNMSFSPNLPDMFEVKEVNYENLYHGFTEYCNQFSEPIHICGLSLGGILALQYAIEYPNRVASLVLIGTQYVMPKKLLAFQNVLFRLMPNSMFQEMGFGKKDFMNLSNSMMELDYSGKLKEINCPVLVLCGAKDNANKKAAIALGEAIPKAKFRVIENSGHEVNVQAPEKLGEILQEFYKELEV